MDLEILVVRFFDKAIHHAVRGFEAAAGPWGIPSPSDAPGVSDP
jgi:hypothetical protein